MKAAMIALPYDRSGKMSDRGIYRYINGDIYDGDWIDDKRSGKGMKKLRQTVIATKVNLKTIVGADS